jgi:hypothetical protein
MKPDELADDIVLNYPEANRARKSISEAIRIAIAEERDRCVEIAESEPNLEGPMPDENWVMSQRVRLEDHLRATVDATKRNIAKRIRGT